jgi:hypothetical protein
MLAFVFAFPPRASRNDATLELSSSLNLEVFPSSPEGMKQFATVPVIPELLVGYSK